jgi:hypothetical protein
LDPRGITPFLPYVIRGDLVSLLDSDNGSTFISEDAVSFLDHFTDHLPTFLQMNPPNDVGSIALGGSASDEDDHLAPATDQQSSDLPYCDDDFDLCWDPKTITICDVMSTLLFSVVCFTLIMACFIKVLSIDD